MAPHSSTLAWRIPWKEEPGGLQSMGSLRLGHDWVTSLSLFTFMHWRRKWQPTPVFLPGESQGQEPDGLPSMGLHRVGHDWSDLAAAAAHFTECGSGSPRHGPNNDSHHKQGLRSLFIADIHQGSNMYMAQNIFEYIYNSLFRNYARYFSVQLGVEVENHK